MLDFDFALEFGVLVRCGVVGKQIFREMCGEIGHYYIYIDGN